MLVVRIISLVFASWFATVNPVLEQAKAEFKKANEAFMQDVFSVKMNYHIYKQAADAKPNDIKTGSYYKNGDVSYSLISGIESIRTKTSVIAIQAEEKTLVVSNAAKKDNNISMSPDSLLKFCSQIKRTEPTANLIKYELIFRQDIDLEFEKLEVFINKNGFVLSKIVMYYPRQEVPSQDEADQTEMIQPKMEVIYSNYSKIVSLDKSVFAEQSYVQLVAPNKYKGVGKYSGYQIYNQKTK